MGYVTIDRMEGGYIVSRIFRSLPAAMRGVDSLLTVRESAFMPAEPATSPPLAQGLPAECLVHARVNAQLEIAEQDDPPPHDGRAERWPTHPVDEE